MGALPLAGGMLTGQLGVNGGYGKVESYDSNVVLRAMYPANDSNNSRRITMYNKNNKSNVKDALQLNETADGTTSSYYIYGEHNKPIGSYTGNGNTAERMIETGGMGRGLLIYCNYGVALVTPSGGFYGTSNSQFAHFGSEVAAFSDGKLIVKSALNVFNQNGVTYYYQCL